MASISTVSPLRTEIWAKSSRGGETAGETLVAHTLWALRNLRAFAERAQHLPALCRRDNLIELASLAVILHDAGKAAAGFQSMLRGGPRFEHRHEVLSLALLPWVFGEAEPPSEDMLWVAAAIVTHHKDWPKIQEAYTLTGGISPNLQDLQSHLTAEFVERAQQTVQEIVQQAVQEGLRFPEEWCRAIWFKWSPGSAIAALNRILNALDCHIHSLQQQRFPSRNLMTGRFLRGLMILADHSGSAHAKVRGAAALDSVESASRAVCGFSAAEFHYHQLRARDTVGNALMVAPTGSGKTEAAMLWASRQIESGGGRLPLFYMLPFQASLNAMRWRLGAAFSETNVTLQHSRALQAVYSRWLNEDGIGRREAEIKARRESNLARLHTAPIRILTPYQVLRGMYQLPGHEALLTDAASGVFILDEIHAYEPTRLGMILAMLRHLVRDEGVRILAMSATMPRCLADLIAEHCSIAEANCFAASRDTMNAALRHRVHLVPENLLSSRVRECIAEKAAAGKSVLVVATTVDRAQQAAAELSRDGRFSTEILHGRFNARDRGRKEQELMQTVGVGTRLESHGKVLVATQVVEVSLNVDFDVLYSDPAPLEALLQRFGRVNRGRPAGSPLCPVQVCTSIPEHSAYVYDSGLVKAALHQLARFDSEPLPESEIQEMLDVIYADEYASKWTRQVRDAGEKFERDAIATARPFRSDGALREQFERLFDGYEVIPAPLAREYESLLEDDLLMASSLAVSISGRQFHRLCREGRIRRTPEAPGCLIADCGYTSEEGLDLKISAGQYAV